MSKCENECYINEIIGVAWKVDKNSPHGYLQPPSHEEVQGRSELIEEIPQSLEIRLNQEREMEKV
jgi:hypothetical protein